MAGAGEMALLLLPRTRIQFPAPTWVAYNKLPLHIQGNLIHFSAPHGHIPTHRQHIRAQFKKILKSFHGATLSTF